MCPFTRGIISKGIHFIETSPEELEAFLDFARAALLFLLVASAGADPGMFHRGVQTFTLNRLQKFIWANYFFRNSVILPNKPKS